MKLDKKVVNLLNEQIKNELYSAYLYLDMSNYYNEKGLSGFENWFYIQAQEERDHAMLLRSYLMSNDEKVVLLPIDAPKEDNKDAGTPLYRSLEHEQLVTGYINAIYDAAAAVKDYRTMEFLNWFVKEQCEEEDNARSLIGKYELAGKDPVGLYLLDQELQGRSYSAPQV